MTQTETGPKLKVRSQVGIGEGENKSFFNYFNVIICGIFLAILSTQGGIMSRIQLQGNSHLVHKGETLTGIARQQVAQEKGIAAKDVSREDLRKAMQELAKINHIKNPNFIRANHRLVMPETRAVTAGQGSPDHMAEGAAAAARTFGAVNEMAKSTRKLAEIISKTKSPKTADTVAKAQVPKPQAPKPAPVICEAVLPEKSESCPNL